MQNFPGVGPGLPLVAQQLQGKDIFLYVHADHQGSEVQVFVPVFAESIDDKSFLHKEIGYFVLKFRRRVGPAGADREYSP